MSKRTETDRTDETGLDANRRHVLQGIGAAGVASAVMAGSAGATGGGFGRAQANVALQEDQEDIPISTQFYSYRETELSVEELIQESADAGYDAFETYSIGPDSDVEPVLEAMDETGLEMSSAHISIDDVENNTEAMGETFSELGNPILIDPGAGPDDWGNEDAVVEFAQRCNEAADLMAEYDLEFGHHNHDAEFAEIDDTTGYDVFAEELDSAQIQLDVGWVLVGGRDPVDFIIDHSEVVRTLHMKNMSYDGEFTEIDEGDVGMRGVATAFRNTGDTEYLVFEHDEPEDPLESMENGAYWLEILNQPYMPGGICAIPDADTHPAKLHDPEEEVTEDDEETEEDDEAANGGGEALEPGTIELLGNTSGWIGTSPDAIADEENPTLELAVGETYVVEWTNDDGAPHDFVVLNADGEDLVGTDIVSGSGEVVTLEFEVTEEMAEYYCSVHPGTMRGEVAVGGAGDQEGE